jgi:hypothetical protein
LHQSVVTIEVASAGALQVFHGGLHKGVVRPALLLDQLHGILGAMEQWREKALEALPELRRELGDEREVFSPYALWFELLPRVCQAHRDQDDKFLGRVYGLAEWCRSQPEQEIWNSVGVSFYEHLFDEAWMRPHVPRWLSDQAVADAWSLWEYRLPPDAMAEVRKLLGRRAPDRGRPSRRGDSSSSKAGQRQRERRDRR